ncbi:hypothetical protein A6U98_21330 [Rhizobium sp. WYCCWR10014]|jgi:hypothetical protein|nr:hypothetical protein KS05_17670 [Rhizobium brockwellii]OAV55023.1 hypothetical protein A6U98_21330 [Rhizobium sp. WYCCWR10014]
MTKRKRAFFVKRVRDGTKGFAKADYGKREVAIEDIGKSKWKPKKPKQKRSGEGHKMAPSTQSANASKRFNLPLRPIGAGARLMSLLTIRCRDFPTAPPASCGTKRNG